MFHGSFTMLAALAWPPSWPWLDLLASWFWPTCATLAFLATLALHWFHGLACSASGCDGKWLVLGVCVLSCFLKERYLGGNALRQACAYGGLEPPMDQLCIHGGIEGECTLDTRA